MEKPVYRKTGKQDVGFIDGFIKERWGSEWVVVHNKVYRPCNLNGFILIEQGKITGLITYSIEEGKCEIVTLDSLKEKRGVGSELVRLVAEEALKRLCSEVWLITTNDNKKAASFYEKRGFKLTQIYRGAVDEARKIKPEIPLKGENGVPIRDEYKYSMQLPGNSLEPDKANACF